MTKYTSTSVLNYNNNPPSDDGSQTEANKVKYSTIKTKLSDPLDTFASSIDSNISSAFNNVFLVTTEAQSSNFTVASNEDGKSFICTGTITITLPANADIYTGYTILIYNDGSGTLTVSPDGSDTINGGGSLSIPADEFAILQNNGSDWNAFSGTKTFTINPLTDVTITASDEIAYADISDSNNMKKDTVQGILDLVAGDLSGKADVVIATGDKITLYDSSDSDNPKTDTVQGILDLVNDEIAGLAEDSIGTYMLAETDDSGTYDFGDTISGSNLDPSSAGGNNGAQTPSGTWRCMGYAIGTGGSAVTLWLRIS